VDRKTIENECAAVADERICRRVDFPYQPFVGYRHYRRAVDPALRAQLANVSRDILHDSSDLAIGRESAWFWPEATQMLPILELYWRSDFCPHPIGDAPTRKAIVDSLAMGCIPVFTSWTTRSQWEWHWGGWINDASVLIPTSEGLIDKLRQISTAKIAEMRRVVAQNAHRLQYHAVDSSALQAVADPQATDGLPTTDAFEIALQGAWTVATSVGRAALGRDRQKRAAAVEREQDALAAACHVRLMRKLSFADCQLGKTFGCYDGEPHHFWVQTCRGFFRCNATRLSATVQCGGKSDNHRVVNCSCAGDGAEPVDESRPDPGKNEREPGGPGAVVRAVRRT